MSGRDTRSAERANRLAEDDKRRPGGPDAPSVLSSWARAIVRALDARGVDGRALAGRAGLDPAAFADPGARAPVTATGRLWRLAVEATGDSAFGLFASRFLTFPTFQALGVAVLASASVKEAFQRLVRYSRIVSDAAEHRLEDAHDRYRLILAIAPGADLAPEAVDAVVSLEVRTLRALHGERSVGPLSVALERPEPTPSEAYRRFFRAPVTFSAPANVLDFSRELIEAPLPSGQADIARRTDEVLARHLAERDTHRVAGRVRALILDRLPDGEPSQEGVARALGMGLRTLQRRLADEGTSFAGLLTGIRRDLATSYLRESRWAVTEVAFALGFADVGSFSRAFRRWTGVTPSEYAAGRSCAPT